MIYTMTLGRAALVLILLAPIGCKNTTTITPSDASQSFGSTEMFTGTLSVQGSKFHSFSLPANATATVTLASLRLAGTNTTLSVPVRLLLGSPSADGATCTGTTTATGTPRLTAHLSQDLVPGAYCVSVADIGELPGDVDFGVRIFLFSGDVSQGQAGTEKFSSNLYPGGTVNRTFVTNQSGDIVVTLTDVQPGASIGFGLGITTNNSDCLFNQATIGSSGSRAELRAQADSGGYCVRVFDPGTLPNRVTFFIDITHQ